MGEEAVKDAYPICIISPFNSLIIRHFIATRGPRLPFGPIIITILHQAAFPQQFTYRLFCMSPAFVDIKVGRAGRGGGGVSQQ